MKKKLTLLLLSVLCVSTLAIGFTACTTGTPSADGDNDDQIMAIYNLYSADAVDKGKTPLSYDDWLKSIKGETGATGKSAYEIALENGFEGTEIEWLASLKGEKNDGDGTPCTHNLSLTYEIFTDKHAQLCSECNEFVYSEHDFSKKEYCECGFETPVYGTKELTFELNEDGESYKVTGLSKAVTEVEIPAEHWGLPVTVIGESAFEDNQTITSVIIPDTVTTIEYSAFYGCQFENITIPDSVTSIGEIAFGYTPLTSITIPASVQYLGEGALYYCEQLTEIEVATDNPNYKTVDGNLYTKDGTVILAYRITKPETSFTIPNGVTRIGAYAFCISENLTEIIIPEGVTSIGEGAFLSCYSVESFTLPESLTEIGYNAFGSCEFTEITIPKNVTKMDEKVFEGCTSLTVYCAAEEKPDGWNDLWNAVSQSVATRPTYKYCKVVWGYTGEEE